MLTYGNAAFKTAASAACNGAGPDDVLLAVAPLYHIAGMVMGVNLPVHTGATAVLMHRFDPLGVAQALERHRTTWWYSIAPMNVALMQVPGAKDMDWSALNRIRSPRSALLSPSHWLSSGGSLRPTASG